MTSIIYESFGMLTRGFWGDVFIFRVRKQKGCTVKFGLGGTGIWFLTLFFSFAALQGTPSSADRKAENVILVVLDQLQADRLHCYGNPRETSPNMDRLAQRGVRFSQHYSVAPWTTPTYATMMTGLFPSRHGSTVFSRTMTPYMPPIDKTTPMLAEVFKSHGYRTAAFVNNALGGRGLTDRGFEEYYQYQQPTAPTNIVQRSIVSKARPYTARAPETMNRLLPWLDQHASERFFVFVLFWEPSSDKNHQRPYAASLSLRSRACARS